MKIVHSFWSKPWFESNGVHGVQGGWPTNLHYWAGWALSASLAHRAYGRVELVTDSVGARVLVDKLGLPYESVRVVLDDFDVPPYLWAAGKLKAYAVQDEPFWHVDSDGFIKQRLPASFEAADVLVQNVENDAALQGTFDRAYICYPYVHHFDYRIDGWDQRWRDRQAYNMGIFGGTNVGAIRGYAEQALRMVTNPANAGGWRRVAEGGANGVSPWDMCVVIEQQAAYCYFASKGVNVTPIIGPDEWATDRGAAANRIGWAHLMYRRRLPEWANKVLQRLASEFPDTWRKLEAFEREKPVDAVNVVRISKADVVQPLTGTPVMAVDRRGNQLPEPTRERSGTRGGCGCGRNVG